MPGKESKLQEDEDEEYKCIGRCRCRDFVDTFCGLQNVISHLGALHMQLASTGPWPKPKQKLNPHNGPHG